MTEWCAFVMLGGATYVLVLLGWWLPDHGVCHCLSIFTFLAGWRLLGRGVWRRSRKQFVALLGGTVLLLPVAIALRHNWAALLVVAAGFVALCRLCRGRYLSDAKKTCNAGGPVI